MTSEFERELRRIKLSNEEETRRRQLDRERVERELEQSLLEHERLRLDLVLSFRPSIDDLMKDVGEVAFGSGQYAFSFSYYKFGEKIFTRTGYTLYRGSPSYYDIFEGESLAQWSAGRADVYTEEHGRHSEVKRTFILNLGIDYYHKDALHFKFGGPESPTLKYNVPTDIGSIKENLTRYMLLGPTREVRSLGSNYGGGGDPFSDGRRG